MVTAVRNIRTTLEMIKIEHTLFALPFAFLGAVLAAGGLPTARQALWITLAMVGARSAAMAFNRIADRAYDAANPRTATRAIPAGQLSLPFAWAFTAASAALFFLAAAMLNRLTLLLAPVALASVLLYSYTKRFTSLSHVVLGWCLSIAPTGAWVAVRGALDSPVPLLLSLVVLLWTAGFDVLYACQDYDFDRRAGLRSIPARVGVGARAVGLAAAPRGGVRGARWVILSDRPGRARARGRAGDRRPARLPALARARRRSVAAQRGVLHDERLRQRHPAGDVRRRRVSDRTLR